MATTASTAIAEDSRQIPVRRLEMAAESTMPASTPPAVLRASWPTKSPAGPVSEFLPESSAPATASASTAPVGSLKADSATTVCATLGRSREPMKSGMRIAGSVGESTAPMSRPCSKGRPKTSAAAAPVMTAVTMTPTTASRPRLSQTLRRISSDRFSPP